MDERSAHRLLWLIRHAQARDAHPGEPDQARELTRQGRRQAEALARWLAPRIAAHDPLILVSPAIRTRVTAEIALRPVDQPRIRIEDALWAADLHRLTGLIHTVGQPLVLIGHNPGLEQLQHWLTGTLLPLPTGGAFEIAMSRDAARLTARYVPDSDST
ncbi:MAG: histidine phosphatase family protein [Wenzhouxiangellaceae bacterium]